MVYDITFELCSGVETESRGEEVSTISDVLIDVLTALPEFNEM